MKFYKKTTQKPDELPIPKEEIIESPLARVFNVLPATGQAN